MKNFFIPFLLIFTIHLNAQDLNESFKTISEGDLANKIYTSYYQKSDRIQLEFSYTETHFKDIKIDFKNLKNQVLLSNKLRGLKTNRLDFEFFLDEKYSMIITGRLSSLTEWHLSLLLIKNGSIIEFLELENGKRTIYSIKDDGITKEYYSMND